MDVGNRNVDTEKEYDAIFLNNTTVKKDFKRSQILL